MSPQNCPRWLRSRKLKPEARGANAPCQEHGGSTVRCGGLVTKVEQRRVNGDVRVRLCMRRVVGWAAPWVKWIRMKEE